MPANEPRKQATKPNLVAGIPTGFENIAAVTSDSNPEQGTIFKSAVRRPGSIAARGSLTGLNITREGLEKCVIDKKDYLEPSTPSDNKTANQVDNDYGMFKMRV